MKKILDNPWLAPLTTPLKWIGTCLATTMGPYISAAQSYKYDTSNNNPVVKYFGLVADEMEGLVFPPLVLGGIGGLIGGIALSAHLLAGCSIPVAIVGGIAVTSATIAATAAVAPAALGVGIAALTLIAATSVATVPGVLAGLAKTAKHAFGSKAAAAPAQTASAAPAAPAPTTMEQLAAHLSSLSEAEQKQILDKLMNKAGKDFAIEAAATAGIAKDIAVSKTIQLKKPKAAT